MLTAKDINNKRFEQVKSGYSPNEVDDFLREIALLVSSLQKEKEETQKKIEVLVESIREYKKDEEALKDALIGAQKQGRAVVAEAQAHADRIMSEATVKAGDIIGSTKLQLEREKHNLTKMQQEVSDFKSSLLAMYKNHLAQITSIPDYDDDDDEAVPVSETQTAQPASEPEDEAAVTAEQQTVLNTSRTAETNANPFGDSYGNRSRFSDLKFGENK